MELKHLWARNTLESVDADTEYEMTNLRALVKRERAAAARAWEKGDKAKWRHYNAVARAYQRGITALGFIGFPF